MQWVYLQLLHICEIYVNWMLLNFPCWKMYWGCLLRFSNIHGRALECALMQSMSTCLHFCKCISFKRDLYLHQNSTEMVD